MPEMRQFEYEGIKIVGTPPNTDKDYVSWCPKCGRRLMEHDEGYGPAGGGGLGHYIWCSNSRCDWYYKWLDADEGTAGGRDERG